MLKRRHSLLILAVLCTMLPAGSAKGIMSFPRQIIDDSGYTVVISTRPERIISLAPSATEILFAIGAGDNMVGVTTYCDFPAQARSIDKVGGFTTPNIEGILAKQPDLVFASYRKGKESIERLRELGVTVISFDSESVDGILQNIRLAGQATGYEADAEKLVQELRTKVNLVKEQSSKVPDNSQNHAEK